MNILAKIILSVFTIGGLIFLVFFSFFQQNTTTLSSLFYEGIDTTETYHLVDDSDGILELSNTTADEQIGVLAQYLSDTDRVFYSQGAKIGITSDKNNIDITLEQPGVFLLELYDLNKNYTVKGSGFTVSNKGPGIIFINALDIKKTLVFPLNTIAQVSFISKSEKLLSSLDLFPHSYLIFNPFKASLVRGGDLSRISQIFTLDYVSTNILSDGEIRNSLLEILFLKKTEHISFFTYVTKYIQEEMKQKNISTTQLLEQQQGIFPGEEIITKFMSFFVNDSKKIIYLKTLALRNVISLIQGDGPSESYISKINRDLGKIKSMDPSAYDELLGMIYQYYAAIIGATQEPDMQIRISHLIHSIEGGSDDSFNIPSLIFLKNQFYSFDFLNDSNFYNSISQFTNKYVSEYLNKKDNNKLQKESLLFFLEKLLTAEYSRDDITIKNLGIILQDYIETGIPIQTNRNNKVDALYTNYKILSKFTTLIREIYFYKERNKFDLLVLSEKRPKNRADIESIEKNLKEITEFYKKFQDKLDENKNSDISLVKNYNSLLLQLEEYSLAIANYDKYTSEYDLSKKELLEENTINEGRTDTSLSVEKITHYISQFNGINIKNITFTIRDYQYCENPNNTTDTTPVIDGYCYEIKNMLINNQTISFLLFPFEKNRIDTIFVNKNGQKTALNGSYKLDDIKIVLSEKLKSAKTQEAQEAYSFKNFFLNTFTTGQKSITGTVDTSLPVEEETESKSDRSFKGNQLLGTSGDFSTIKDFVQISYNDIYVERSNGSVEYEITVTGSPFTSSIQIGNGSKATTVAGELSGNYIYKDLHSFKNLELKFINTSIKKEKTYLFGGSGIYIDGTFQVSTIESDLYPLFNKIPLTQQIYTLLNNEFNISPFEISLAYTDNTQILSVNTTYKQKPLTLTIGEGNEIKALYNNSVLPYEDISVNTLKPILLTIQ